MNFIEQNYKEKVVIYIDVWDDKCYISNDGKNRSLLMDTILKKNIKKFKIASIDVIPLKEIKIEFKSKPYIEKTKFMIKYFSTNSQTKGLQIEDNIFFYRESPNKY